MSTPNGGSLDDCVTNIFALTELSGLQWRQYESPPWSGDANPRTLLQTEPIFVAYSKLQTDGILSVWRRVPLKVLPQVVSTIPFNGGVPKELWVFWYGTTEPEEIEKHCKDLIKKKRGEDEVDDGTINSIPYDVRTLLYKAWNTQLERHYRAKRYVQIGRWFIRPNRFIDPSSAFMIDDFAIAYTHSFNIVGGNSMCVALKPQLQPNLVLLSPFHLERNKKFKDIRVNVILAPWSQKAHISLRYSVVPHTKKEEEEVERQLALWKETNLVVDGKKRRKRRKDEGMEIEGEDSEEEGWKGMPKMVRVETDGGVRMWWPTQYVVVTLEETRRLVRSRFPVANQLKSVPQIEPTFSKGRYAHFTSSEPALRISQARIDDDNFLLKPFELPEPEDVPKPDAPDTTKSPQKDEDITVIYTKLGPLDRFKRPKVRKIDKHRRQLEGYDVAINNQIEKGAGVIRCIRLPSVSEDGQEVVEELKKEETEAIARELDLVMKGNRYNWRSKNGLPLEKRDVMLKSCNSSSSEGEEGEINEKRKKGKDKRGKEKEKEKESEQSSPDKISRDMSINSDHSAYHFDRSRAKRHRKSNGTADDERLARSPFTPVRVLTPINKAEEMQSMARDIEMEEIGKNSNRAPKDILNTYGTYFNVNAAETSRNIQYKKYHKIRSNDGKRENNEDSSSNKKTNGRSTHDRYHDCSSDDGSGPHKCNREHDGTPEIVKVVRPHKVPEFKKERVGGVDVPPVLEVKPDKVIRGGKSSPFHPIKNASLEFPKLEASDDGMELDLLKDLATPREVYDYGSDEDSSTDDRKSTSSFDFQPLSVAAVEDAGEGTSSGAENWREEDVDMPDEFVNMDSSGDLMDCMPPNDSVLSPPASNERADSNNSMYHRLPGGPHSVGDSGVLNKIYPTPPSLLQVDICSPAAMGGPHSQAMKEDKDDASSECSEGEGSINKYMNEIDELEKREMRETRGNHQISHLHTGLFSRKFFDNEPKTDVPVSHRFGSLQRRPRVSEKTEIRVYDKKDGEILLKGQIDPKHVKALAGLDNFTSRRSVRPTAPVGGGSVAGQPWLQQQQQMNVHPSLAAHQLQQQMQMHHQSQPGPSTMAPPQQPHMGQMQPQHPAYMAGASQMGSYRAQPGMQYPPQYAGGVQQHPMQQPGFPQQQQPPQYMGVQGQMMMTGQPGQASYGVPMRPPGYPGYPQGAVAPMGGAVHPSMQTPGGMPPMGYPAGMQNQMMYRPGMPQGSYPPQQYAGQMGSMMGTPGVMGGMQYPGGQMQQPGMMMPQMQHAQTMIAGAPHPMGMVQSHPTFQPPALPSTAASTVAVVSAQQRPTAVKAMKKKTRQLSLCPVEEEATLMATRRGEDPYVNSLRIAPRRTFYRGNNQLKAEFDLYTTELILDKERKKGDRSFGAPSGGSEGLSVVAAVMLQDTILNLHFDWVFDSCPICACTTSIRSRELGMYIQPPDELTDPVQVQNMWIGPGHGFHSDTPDTTCNCGFSVIRHRQLSMRAGLFLEDSVEATGDLESGTNPEGRFPPNIAYFWFDPTKQEDRAMVETLRSLALTTDIGRYVSAIKQVSTIGGKNDKKGRKKRSKTGPISVGSIGTPNVEYVMSQLDCQELLSMGNAALEAAKIEGSISPPTGESPYFHPWGLQIASEVADPTEMDIKNLLEDVKPLIEGAVREARKLPSTPGSSVIEGPLTWRALAAKNIKSSTNGDDESHVAEPIPLIELATEKEAIRVAPTVIKSWEQYNLGPIDVPKDVLYLAIVPDDDRVYDMMVAYLRRLSKMYEQNLRLGRHVGYLARDEPMRTQVREGIVRAIPMTRTQFPFNSPSPDSPAQNLIKHVDRYAKHLGCNQEFTEKLLNYVKYLEEVLYEHLFSDRIYERDVFRECVAYALWNRKLHQKQKGNTERTARHERDTEDGSPHPGQAEEDRKREEEKYMEKKRWIAQQIKERKKKKEEFKGALAEAMGMAEGSSEKKEKKKRIRKRKRAKKPFGQYPPYGMEDRCPFNPPDEEPAALPQTVVIYLPLWPCFGNAGRNGEAARVTILALVKAFNSVMKRLNKYKYRAVCQLELIPLQRLEEAVGAGADLDRLDRSSNLNTWQLTSMARNGEIYPTDRPRMEDILKEVALGVYRRPRYLHCESLKNSLPKSMTKFGPASATLDWIDKGGKKKTIYECQSVPFQLANTPSIMAKNDAKFSSLCLEEISLYFSYCLVATDHIIVTLTDNLGARLQNVVLTLKPTKNEIGPKFRSRNSTSVRDGLDKVWKYIEGVMLLESKPLRLVIGKLGKMGHGEFKAWCHVLSRSNLKKYSTRLREGCTPCAANAGAPMLLSACLVSTEPEAHLQVLPSYSSPPDTTVVNTKKTSRPLHTPGDNTITHIMVFPISTTIQLTTSGADMGGGLDDDADDFGDMDLGNVVGDMGEIMDELMTGEGEGGERAAQRNQHMNSFFDGALEAGVQNQPLAAGWMISTAPAGDLPDWFWSSCPSLKRRMPVHLRSSLHINEAQLSRSDEIMKKEKEQESNHALDSTKTDEVLRHVLEQYNDLSWLSLDSITQERRSCLPIHIQHLIRAHDTILHTIM